LLMSQHAAASNIELTVLSVMAVYHSNPKLYIM
jgi:hypothetical protein